MQQGLQDATWAVTMIDAALAVLRDDAIHLGGSRIPPMLPGEPAPLVQASARLTIVLSGTYRRRISVAGERRDPSSTPGAACLLSPGGWDVRLVGEACSCAGLVFGAQYLRVLEVRHSGGARLHPAPRWHHTSTPLSGSGLQILSALNLRAEAGGEPNPADAHLVRALLFVARQHCQEQTSHVTRGQSTWQAVREFLLEHAHEDLSRDGVARRFRLHATYLSELCQRHGGAGFHRQLEDIRLERVRRLLTESDHTVAQVAKACGFNDVGTCIRAFRRQCGTTPNAWRQRGSTPS